MCLSKETQCNTFLSAVRRFLEREGLFIEDKFVIQQPNIVFGELFFIFCYYIVSLFLLWVDAISFWALILNCICLVRSIIKTILKNEKYFRDLEQRTNNDCLNRETKFFLNNCCGAYNRARKRENTCVIIILVAAIVIGIKALQVAWIAPFMRFASSVALLGAAWDDFLSDAEVFFEAHPPIPDFNG